MDSKERKRRIFTEVLVLLGALVVFFYITRLWPILLLLFLAIPAAAIQMFLFPPKQTKVIEPMKLPMKAAKEPDEQDIWELDYSVMISKITLLVAAEYPEARWIWEAPNHKRLIQEGQCVFILLNRAGGYRRAKVVIRNLQVIGIEYQTMPKEGSVQEMTEPVNSDQELEEDDLTEEKENYELLAFEWVDAHIFDLNDKCNEAIGHGLLELILPAEELPVRDSWINICKELSRTGLEDTVCVPEGIKINLTQ